MQKLYIYIYLYIYISIFSLSLYIYIYLYTICILPFKKHLKFRPRIVSKTIKWIGRKACMQTMHTLEQLIVAVTPYSLDIMTIVVFVGNRTHSKCYWIYITVHLYMPSLCLLFTTAVCLITKVCYNHRYICNISGQIQIVFLKYILLCRHVRKTLIVLVKTCTTIFVFLIV